MRAYSGSAHNPYAARASCLCFVSLHATLSRDAAPFYLGGGDVLQNINSANTDGNATGGQPGDTILSSDTEEDLVRWMDAMGLHTPPLSPNLQVG